MDKYAIIQNGVVINYVAYESPPENPPPSFPEDTIAVMNNNIGVGWTYADGVFTPPQPYPSWILVDNVWQPPIPYPSEGGPHTWDESTQSWV